MFNTVKRIAIANPMIGVGVAGKTAGGFIETVGATIKLAGFACEIKGRIMKLSSYGVGVEGANNNPEIATTAIANHYSCGSYVKLVPLLNADWAKQNCATLQAEFDARTKAAGGKIPTEKQQQPAPTVQPEPTPQTQPQPQQTANPFAEYTADDADVIDTMLETC